MLEPFEVAGQTYTAGKLDAMTQFHVARRLAPVISTLAEGFQHGKPADAFAVLEPAAKAMALMTDADSEYVLGKCLAVVRRKQGEMWAPVRAGNGGIMFEDIDLSAMLQLAWKVLEANLMGFSFALPPILAGAPPAKA